MNLPGKKENTSRQGLDFRGGSRISVGKGTNLPAGGGGGHQDTIIPNISEKLHEIERILGREWGGGGCTPGFPLDPPMDLLLVSWFFPREIHSGSLSFSPSTSTTNVWQWVAVASSRFS